MSGICRLIWGALVVGSLMLAGGPTTADFIDPMQKSGGLIVYAGVVPASIVQGHARGHVEATMHGGLPGPNARHFVLAIFDERTGARVEDATVSATLSQLGHIERRTLRFESMRMAGTVTYGAYGNYSSSGRYELDVSVRRPGQSEPVRVTFVDDFSRR